MVVLSGQDVQQNLALRQYDIIAHSLKDDGVCVVYYTFPWNSDPGSLVVADKFTPELNYPA